MISILFIKLINSTVISSTIFELNDSFISFISLISDSKSLIIFSEVEKLFVLIFSAISLAAFCKFSFIDLTFSLFAISSNDFADLVENFSILFLACFILFSTFLKLLI